MKKLQISHFASARNYYLKRGMRLFYELNQNLNAYKQSFEKEKVIQDDEARHLI